MPGWMRSDRSVPPEHRASFLHLYLDIVWFGVQAASALAFVAVYAARQGADSLQIGLLNAGPGFVNLLFTLPAGRWLEKQVIGVAVTRAAVLNRLFYLLWIILPVLLAPQGQIWALIVLTLVMSIPGTALAVGFNALFADAVPPEWRAHVAGIRNAALSIAYIVVSLLSGQILIRLPFPTGYQVVFGIGCLGAVMSTVHLYFVRPGSRSQRRPESPLPPEASAPEKEGRSPLGPRRPAAKRVSLVSQFRLVLTSADVLKGSYGRLIGALLFFYLALHLAIPLFPIHFVKNLHLTDSEIAWGSALFFGAAFLSSTQLSHLVRKLGNQRVTALGGLFLCLYPGLLSLASGLDLYLVGSAAGGVAWALVNGALVNYLLETIPGDHRPAYLVWYNLALNAALVLGSLTGPLIANVLGLRLTLGVSAALRLIAAMVILAIK